MMDVKTETPVPSEERAVVRLMIHKGLRAVLVEITTIQITDIKTLEFEFVFLQNYNL